MTRAELTSRWLAGEAIEALQAECKGSAEDALREEMRLSVNTLQASLAQVHAIASAFDDAAAAEFERHESKDWGAGYRSGLGAGFSRGAYALGTLYNWISMRIIGDVRPS